MDMRTSVAVDIVATRYILCVCTCILKFSDFRTAKEIKM